MSKDIFILNGTLSFYLTSNPVIWGFVSTENVVAYYTIAEKSVRIICYVLSSIIQALFSHYSIKFYNQSLSVSVGQIKSLIFKLSPIVFLVTIGVTVFAKHIVLILSTRSITHNIVINIY